MTNNAQHSGYTFEQFRTEFMKMMRSQLFGTPIRVDHAPKFNGQEIPIVIESYRKTFPKLNGTLEFNIARPEADLSNDENILGIILFLSDYTKSGISNDGNYDPGATNSFEVCLSFQKGDPLIGYQCYVSDFIASTLSQATGRISFEDISSLLSEYPDKLLKMFQNAVKPLEQSGRAPEKPKCSFRFDGYSPGPGQNSGDRTRAR